MFSYTVCILSAVFLFIGADCRLHKRRHPSVNEELTLVNDGLAPINGVLASENAKFSFGSDVLPSGSVELSSESEKLSNKSEQLSPTSEKVSPRSEDLLPGSKELSPGSEEFSHESVGLPPGTEELSPGSEQLSHRSEELSRRSEESSHRSEELSHESEELSPGIEEFSHESVGLLPGREELTHRTEELSPRSEQLSSGIKELPRRSEELSLGCEGLSSEIQELSPRSSEELSHESEELAPRSVGWSREKIEFLTEKATLTSENDGLSPDTNFEFSSVSPSLTSILQTTRYPDSNPDNFYLKRRREKARKQNKRKKKFDNEKILEDATMSNALNKNDYLKNVIHDLEDDIVDNNATVIPLPRGLQIKTVSKQNDGRVNATMNITSNTQKLLSFDNATEIENVVEMQMEKEIEDDKGANRGSEEIRIVETERVKPVVVKEWNGLDLRKRKRKSNSKRYVGHHRVKRSKLDSTEVPKLNPTFNKMARRFLSKVRRKERVVERNNLLNRQAIPSFKKHRRRNMARTVKHARDDWMYDMDEMIEFVKFFLKEMQKFRESRDRNKNGTVSINVPNTGEQKNIKLSEHRVKKDNINFEYPEHNDGLMNLIMTLGKAINGYSNTTGKIRESYRNTTIGLETAAIPPVNTSAIPDEEMGVIYADDRKGLGQLIVVILLFSVLISSFMLAVWIFRDKILRTAGLGDKTSEARNFKICHEEGQGDGFRKHEYVAIRNGCAEDFSELEWQSESGNWMSEKELDFK